MTEPLRLFTLWGIDGYPFGLCIAIAVFLGTLLLIGTWRRYAALPWLGLRFALYALPLGLVFSRVFYLVVRWRFLSVDYVEAFWYTLPLGGYSLAGSFAGIVIAAWLVARLGRRPMAEVLDMAAPAALLVLACERLAECFTLDGVGLYVDNEALWHFPFAVLNPYGEYVMPVFFYEALTAFLIMGWLLYFLRKHKRAVGDVALTAMLLLGLTQIFWESLRVDDYLRFGFVRVNQLWGALLAGIALGVWLKRSHPSRIHAVVVSAAFLVCIGVMVGVEFGQDKSTISNGILHAAMALALAGIGLMGVTLRNACVRRTMA